MYLLAIESSCDDTAAAILEDGVVRANCVANQTLHQKYGGVVPEVASRAHQAKIVPVVQEALTQAGITLDDIGCIAFTRGPGLMGSLLVGVSFAKAVALARKIPMVEVHHIQAHVMAHFIDTPKPKFPFLCLTVSGGHTQLMWVRGPLDMEIVGTTIDDAAGEAFDKTGKILGLDYPAGPIIDRYAKEGEVRFEFVEPDIPNFDFSFSGLKTNILYFLKKQVKAQPDFIETNLKDICASVQARIVSILMNKLEAAAAHFGTKEIAIAGGVSANSGLRQAVAARGKALGWNTYIPDFEYCTDNAAMIGMAGYFKYLENDFVGQDIGPLARYTLTK